MNSFYVYIFLDPRKPGKYVYGPYEFDYEPFYVGKGYDRRWQAHFKNKNLERDVNIYKRNKILKILSNGYNKYDVLRFYQSNLSEKEAFNIEKKLIFEIGRFDLKTGPLTNLTDGGEGYTGRIGELHHNFGKKYGSDILKNMSKAHIKYSYKIVSPWQEIFYCSDSSLRGFCKDNNLNNSCMYEVANGKYLHHKGWIVHKIGEEYLRYDVEKRNYKITACSPEGIFFENIIQFEKQFNDLKLNYNVVRRFIKNGKTYKDWYFFKESF